MNILSFEMEVKLFDVDDPLGSSTASEMFLLCNISTIIYNIMLGTFLHVFKIELQ